MAALRGRHETLLPSPRRRHEEHIETDGRTDPMRTFLLLIAYYLVVTPLGLLSRLVNDPLARRWNRRADTYWNATAPSTAR